MNNIAIFIPNLLTWKGDRPIIGGLERYALSLADLLTEIGYNVSFHQYAYQDFEKTHHKWLVYGYEADPAHLHLTNNRMEKTVKGQVLYASIAQQTSYRPGSICISHGVWWELPGSSPTNAQKFYENHVLSALLQAQLIISCDYNFLNVARAIYPNLADKKIRVIPNFVDLQKFSPRPKTKSKGLRILYPRRLSLERGFALVAAIIPNLLSEYEDIEFHFAIDSNIPEHLKAFHTWRCKVDNNERISYSHPDFQDMVNVLADSDIILIPTIYSEGTSFSCLEAMAIGKPIIATNVGGLTNLIIDGYNGLLIHPSKESLYQAIRFLLNNPTERNRLGKNALATAQAFDKNIWKARWQECIKAIYTKG